MRLPLCDTPNRLVARLYTALRVDCGCCTFVRGVTLGAVLGAVLTVTTLRVLHA